MPTVLFSVTIVLRVAVFTISAVTVLLGGMGLMMRVPARYKGGSMAFIFMLFAVTMGFIVMVLLPMRLYIIMFIVGVPISLSSVCQRRCADNHQGATNNTNGGA